MQFTDTTRKIFKSSGVTPEIIDHSPGYTPSERQTTIIMGDYSDTATAYTAQQKYFSKMLQKYTLTRLIQTKSGDTVSACFSMPASRISFRWVSPGDESEDDNTVEEVEELEAPSGTDAKAYLKSAKAAGVRMIHLDNPNDEEPFRGPELAERETIISMNDKDKTADVDSMQTRVVKKLMRLGYMPISICTNYKENRIWGAIFTIPMNAVTLRSITPMNPEATERARARMRDRWNAQN